MNQDSVYLNHILIRCNKIMRLSDSLSFEEFCKNEDLQDIIIRSFEIIGEATTHLSPQLSEKYKNTIWKDLKSFRNVMIHHYFRLDLTLIFDVMMNDVPPLKKDIEIILQDLHQE